MKIYKVKGCYSLDEWSLKKAKEIPGINLFVYYYENPTGYDGSGMAIWRKGRKYGYTYMGHCSCNGPLDDLNSIYYTLTDIRKLAKSKDYEWTEHGQKVLARLEEILKEERE